MERYLAAGVALAAGAARRPAAVGGGAAAAGRPALRRRARAAGPLDGLRRHRRRAAPRGPSGGVARGRRTSPTSPPSCARPTSGSPSSCTAPRTTSPSMEAIDADAPVVPGVMPITNVRQLERMAAMSGTQVPLDARLAAARGRRPARGGPPRRGRARDGAVPGAAGRRRAGAALLHDEPGRGHARGVREPRLGGHRIRAVKVLAIDGGGIRGLIPALVLAEIERRTGRRIADVVGPDRRHLDGRDPRLRARQAGSAAGGRDREPLRRGGPEDLLAVAAQADHLGRGLPRRALLGQGPRRGARALPRATRR